MVASVPLAALRAETGRLDAVLTGLAEHEWSRPTRCEPWDVAALAGHVTLTVGRVRGMLAAPAPPLARVDAAGYYRPDARFSVASNAERIDSAARRSRAGGAAVAADFGRAAAAALAAGAAAPAGRLVTTRHGDAMRLEDFLVTRVVEVAVHGIDLADALGRARWTSAEAAEVVCELLIGADLTVLERAGWDRVGFIAKATGRDRFDPSERARAASLGLTWLTLG